MYVYMYVYMYMYICMYVCMNVFIYVGIMYIRILCGLGSVGQYQKFYFVQNSDAK